MGSLVRMFYQIIVMLLALLFHFQVCCSLNFSSSFHHSPPSCHPQQSSALLKFKNTIHFCKKYSKINSWNQSTDCCLWEGVSCHNLTGHVIGIDLSYSCLQGTLLGNNSLFLLQSLQRLDLSSAYTTLYNSVKFDSQSFGMLARNLTKLTDLALDSIDMSGVPLTDFLNLTSSLESLSLEDCNLRGEFPSQVFGFPYLRYISLDRNEYVTGFFPSTNLSLALEKLRLQSCSFRGSIPTFFGNLTKIIFLDFSNNDFGGQIPSILFNLTQLRDLDLSDNRLEGTLPNVAGRLQFLSGLSLSNNLISGIVASWLFSLPSLFELHLQNNKLTGSIVYVQKPNSLLSDIDLSFNKIQGQIPDFFFKFVDLYSLDLSSNNLSGTIKSNKLAKLQGLNYLNLSNNSLLSLDTDENDFDYPLTNLEYFSFSCCNITQFPNFLRTSTNLEILNLSRNKISGGIAKWEAEGWENLRTLDLCYNSLTSLEQVPGNPVSLDLRSNLIQGPIPSTFFEVQYTNIEFLSISKNKLFGNIPNSICRWELLNVLDLSENNLSGTIPPCLGNIESLKFMNLGMNNLRGKIPDSFSNHTLTNLLLNDNQLEGLIPRSLANCSFLTLLNLRNNKLVDTFPTWLASLPSLQVLMLSFNRLHGSLPNSMVSCSFSTLRIIDVSHNELVIIVS